MDCHQYYEYLTKNNWRANISFNKEFQINCTEEYENVTVQCMVLDTANLIIYGDLITVRIQGKLTT